MIWAGILLVSGFHPHHFKALKNKFKNDKLPNHSTTHTKQSLKTELSLCLVKEIYFKIKHWAVRRTASYCPLSGNYKVNSWLCKSSPVLCQLNYEGCGELGHMYL